MRGLRDVPDCSHCHDMKHERDRKKIERQNIIMSPLTATKEKFPDLDFSIAQPKYDRDDVLPKISTRSYIRSPLPDSNTTLEMLHADEDAMRREKERKLKPVYNEPQTIFQYEENTQATWIDIEEINYEYLDKIVEMTALPRRRSSSSQLRHSRKSILSSLISESLDEEDEDAEIDTSKLKSSYYLPFHQIYFTDVKISTKCKDPVYSNIYSLFADLALNRIPQEKIHPIRVFFDDHGRCWSPDNSRLWAIRKAEIMKVPVVIVELNELAALGEWDWNHEEEGWDKVIIVDDCAV